MSQLEIIRVIVDYPQAVHAQLSKADWGVLELQHQTCHQVFETVTLGLVDHPHPS
jgi:hypothetical protein